MGRLEVVAMNVPGQGARNVEFALDERPVNNEFRLLIGDLAGTPGLDLLTERLEIPLNPVDTDRKRIDDREVLRVFRENRCENA